MSGAGPRLRVGVNLLWLVPGVVGGSEEYATRTLRALGDHRPADIDLVLFGRGALFAAHPELAGVGECVSLPIPGGHRVLRVAAESSWLRRQVRRSRLDIVHHVGGRRPRLGGPSATLVTVHDLQPLDHPENFGLVKRTYLARAIPASVHSATVVIAVSEYVRRQIVDRFGIDPDRVVTVSSGVDGAVADRSRDAELPPRVQALVDRGVPYLIYPAVTHPHKDHDTLLAALARLREQGREVALVLTGGVGAADEHVTRRIAELDLDDRVLRLGRVPRAQLDRLMAAAEALAFPSRFEGFGIPILEAMALGCPVIAADATAVPDVVGDAGVRVRPGDVGAWTQAIADRLDGHPPRVDQARRGRARAALFTWEGSARQLEAAYRLARRLAPAR